MVQPLMLTMATILDPLTVVHRFDQRGCGGSDASNEQTVADLEVLPPTGPWPWHEQPERFRDVLCRFVQSKSTADAHE